MMPPRLRRKAFLAALVIGAVPALAMAVAAARHASVTRAFWIDGKGFRVSRTGADGPADAIREIPDGGAVRVAVPEGLEPTHTMTLEREDGAVGLAVGRRAARGGSLRKTLADQGWESRLHGADTTIPRVYIKPGDKEKAIVFVDENTGDCLLVRQGGK